MKTEQAPSRHTTAIATAFGTLIGVVVAVLTSDVILGVIAGASFIADHGQDCGGSGPAEATPAPVACL